MFAKVFAQILDSSLAEDYLTRLVFEDFLKLADEKGVVDMTPESIARRTNVPLDIVRRGIVNLEKPDPLSRTPDHEGRRIILLDGHRKWGWQIVNANKYRQSATKEMLRMGEAERKAEWRRRKGFSPKSPIPKTEEEGEGEQSLTSPGHVRDNNGDSELLSEAAAIGAAHTAGVPADFAKMVYGKWWSREGRDGAGVKVQWNRHVKTRWNREQGEWSAGTHKGNGNGRKPKLRL